VAIAFIGVEIVECEAAVLEDHIGRLERDAGVVKEIDPRVPIIDFGEVGQGLFNL